MLVFVCLFVCLFCSSFFSPGGVAMVLQHKYFIRKHYVQVPYAVDAKWI